MTRLKVLQWVLVALSLAAASAAGQGLSILTIPASGDGGDCIAVPTTGPTDHWNGFRRFSFEIDLPPEGKRTIGVAIDSTGALRGYIESAVAMISTTVARSQSVVANLSGSGNVQGFKTEVSRGLNSKDSIVPTRNPLDVNQQEAVRRVGQWVKQRCMR